MTGLGRERAMSLGVVIALHAGLLWLIFCAPAALPHRVSDRALATFDVVVPRPPPPPAPHFRPAQRNAAATGRGGITAERSPVVAPSPIILPPVVATAPNVPQQGSAVVGGTAAAGSGSGAGRNGSGDGSGGTGSGDGGGTRARLLSGAITPRDYPGAERTARIGGTVTVTFVVGVDGGAQDCAVTQSSGSQALDDVTCRLVEARFHYAPARDARGTAISERRGWQQRWWLE